MIQVDGGIDETNIRTAVSSGADVIVAGSAIYKNGDIGGNIKVLRAGI